jgi:acetyl esterase/lipase
MSEIRIQSDVTYRRTAERELEADLYLPDAGADRPAIVLVHGGGWENDHRGMFETHLTRLAKHGYVGVDITHRLSSEATFPAPVADVKYGISWLKTRADEYGVDPERVAVGGHSSGAHLAALAATAPDHSALDPDQSSESSAVAAAVVMNGPHNLQKLGQTDPARLFISGFVRRLFGGTYLECPEGYRQASCLTHVDGSEPPVLVMTSTDDEEVPFFESVQFRNQLQSADAPVAFHIADGGGHLAFTAGGDHCEEGIERIRSFLDQSL